MKIIIRVDSSFDGATRPPADVQLNLIGPDTFALVGPDNAPLDTLGRLPMSVLTRQLGARAARLAYARHDGAAGVTSFTAAVGTPTLGEFEVVSPIRTQDPSAGDTHVSDLVLLGVEYELVFRTDAVGPQRITLELVPGAPHQLLAHAHGQDPFGSTTPPFPPGK